MDAFADYREMLKEAFLTKKQTIGSYSHNSFARDIGVSPSYLSLIYSHRRKLNSNRAHAISRRLDWDDDQARIFNSLVRLENAKTSDEQNDIQDEINAHLGADAPGSTISAEQFRVISRWYHSAIIELTRLPDFDPDPRWIGRRLGIDRIEAELAVERLIRLKLIAKKNGKIVRTHQGIATKDQPSVAIRQFHASMLDQAKVALERDIMTERDITGCVIATNPERIKEAKKMIREFRIKLANYLGGGEPTTVYHFALQLFRLDVGVKK